MMGIAAVNFLDRVRQASWTLVPSRHNMTSGGTFSKGKITLPAGCENVNGIGFGWLPDYNGASLKDDENAVQQKKPCFAGYYGQTGL